MPHALLVHRVQRRLLKRERDFYEALGVSYGWSWYDLGDSYCGLNLKVSHASIGVIAYPNEPFSATEHFRNLNGCSKFACPLIDSVNQYQRHLPIHSVLPSNNRVVDLGARWGSHG